MSVKQEMIQLLEQNRGKVLSGQEMADQLGVTRAAIWKAIRVLQEEGYHLGIVKNKGYYLEEHSDVLSVEGIRLHLPEEYKTLKIEVLKTVDSTNNYAKKMSASHSERCLTLAEEQTAGRGRRKRDFYSPYGTGIYMSLVFPVETSLAKFVPITVAASVAVVRAIQKLTNIKCDIKWVNDIYLDGKKICGILTEAVSDFESGILTTVVVGIGLNVSTKEYPEELQEIAGSLLVDSVTRNEFVAAITEELFRLAENLETPELMEEYRVHSCVIGKEITWLEKDEKKEGFVTGMNAQGHLLVETKDGSVTLTAGEISVRTK